MFTKYNAAVLFMGMAVAMLTVPAFRSIPTQPGFYLALIIGLALVAPHRVSARLPRTTGAVALGHRALRWCEQLRRTKSTGCTTYLLGYFIVLVPGRPDRRHRVLEGIFRPAAEPDSASSDDYRFLLVMNATMQIVLLALLLVAGLDYVWRFDAPYAMIACRRSPPCRME